MNKELMTKFIEKKTGLDIKEIISINIKKDDDEYGQIGEHYIVNCISRFENYFSESDNEFEIETFEKKCLVRVDDFERYINANHSVIWLD